MKKLILILFLPAISFADPCDVSSVLTQIRPGEQWSMTNNDPSTLVWLSTTTAPTSTEIQNGIANCPNAINLGQRNTALVDLISGSSDRDKLERAILLTILDQINTLRAADNLSTVTVQQAKTAVQNKITSGSAD